MRTDLHAVCPGCKLRASRALARCPRCGGETLDLRDDGARAKVTALVAPRELPAPLRRAQRGFWAASAWWWDKMGVIFGHGRNAFPWWWLIPGGALTVTMWIIEWTGKGAASSPGLGGWIVLSLLLTICGTIGAMTIVALLALGLAVGFVLPVNLALLVLRGLEAMVRALLHRRHVKRYPRLELAATPEHAEGGERVRGVVKLAAPVRSPLAGTPCAAWRLVGDAHWGAIDDAGGTRFELDTQEGPVTVELGDASVDVRVDARPRRSQVRLPWWPRTLLPPRLAEAVIRAGDEVEVSGACEVSSSSDGYRTIRVARRFEERPRAGTVRIRQLRA